MEIKIARPDSKTPGFLKRQRRFLEISRMIQDEKTALEGLEAMVDFLAEFVVEPEDMEQRREMLWDLSEEEINALFMAMGGSKTPLSQGQKSGS